MGFLIGLIIGLFVGCFIGIFTMMLFAVNGHTDTENNEITRRTSVENGKIRDKNEF